MDIFESRYYNVNRIYFMAIGFWPRENYRGKTALRAFFMITMLILAIPQLISALMHHQNTDRLMLSVLTFFTIIVTWLKLVGLVVREDELKNLFESIAVNWRTIQDDDERRILREYSETGRLLTILYTVFMSMSAVNMSLLPLLPKIMDAIIPLDQPRPNIHLTQGEYFVDRDENFVLPMLFDAFATMMTIEIVVAFNTMYIVSCQHCCALYAIVRYRLLKLKRMVHDNSPASEHGDSYDWVIQTIRLHQTALTFTSTLEDSFSVTFLFILIVYIIIIPLTACAVLANLGNYLNLFPYAVVAGILTINIFITNWPGQTIFDHGQSLFYDTYCNEWYATPIPTKRLLLTMMLRCSQPSMLSAGGIMVMNYETYSMVMRTSISYITVAASFR